MSDDEADKIKDEISKDSAVKASAEAYAANQMNGAFAVSKVGSFSVAGVVATGTAAKLSIAAVSQSFVGVIGKLLGTCHNTVALGGKAAALNGENHTGKSCKELIFNPLSGLDSNTDLTLTALDVVSYKHTVNALEQ